MPTKFSDFTNGSQVKVGDQVVGLRSGNNTRFDFPGAGIKDANGYYMLEWTSPGGVVVNRLQTTSSTAGNEPILGVTGTDADIGLTIASKNNGNINLEPGGSGHVFVAGTNLISIPAGTTAQRPAGFSGGGLRFNSTTGYLEYANGAAWVSVISGAGTVTNVTATLPLTSTGGATPNIALTVPLAGTYGGTGVNNGVNTIEIDGNVEFIGAFTSSFTFTGNTSVTFPTSGTLSTTTGTVTSVTGTAGRITSTGGATPQIDIDATYVGQGSITTVGALASGSLAAGFTPVTVPLGGTGNTTFTAFSVICAGTTATGTFQNVVGLGSSGQVLTSAGAGALPAWQTPTTGTVTSVSGTANQIDSTGGATPTLSLSSTLIAPGTVTVGNLLISTNTISSTNAGGDIILTPMTTGLVEIGANATKASRLRFREDTDNGTNYVTIGAASSLAGDTDYTLPDAYPAVSGYVLSATTGGTMSWVSNGASGITWVNQNSGTATMAANSGYVINNGASLVTLTLPAAAAIGDTFEIVGGSSGGWLVAQNASQQIHFSSTSTTIGIGGSLASTNRYNCIVITCITANTDFTVSTASGSITVV